MIVTRRIHCMLDREPDSYHEATTPGTSVHAVNLGFECESDATDAADEGAARQLYDQFLAMVKGLEFHVYAQNGARFQLIAAATARAQPMDGAPADILAWLDGQPRGNRFWTEPARDLTVNLDIATDEAQARATHLLRSAQSWSAPVAHEFGLTRLIRVAQDLTTPHIVLPVPKGTEPPLDIEGFAVAVDGEDTPLWRVVLDLGGPLGQVECWAGQLQAPVTMPAILSPDGYLLAKPGAEATRRVLDWFERSWGGPLAAIPSLLAPGSLDGGNQLFDPIWIYSPEQPDGAGQLTPESWTLDATGPAWRLFAGLAAALDPVVIALLRPMASSGSGAEGEILAVLISHLITAFDRQPSALAPRDAREWKALLHRFLRRSPLLQGLPVDHVLIDELFRVFDIDPRTAVTPPQARLVDILRDTRIGQTFTFKRSQIGDIAGQLNGTTATGFGANPYELVTMAAMRVQDEGGCEATIIRLFESAMRGPLPVPVPPSVQPATVPDAIHALLCSEAGKPTDDPAMLALVEPLLLAWRGFTTQLNDAFNGLEAVRRSATADFAEALLAQGSDDAATLVTLLQDSACFSTRLLGPADQPGCFDAVVGGLIRVEIGEPHASALRAWLDQQFRDAIAPAGALLNTRAGFTPDLVPHPLPIQVASDFSAGAVDAFAREFNGIAVALRRRDDRKGDTDRWSHANLAGFRWPPLPGPPSELPDAIGLRQWLPVAQDGRAPMFIDYDGFPFASKAIAQASADGDTGLDTARPRLPFFEADIAGYADSQFAPVPMLAYGRTFEAFSFATTNAGCLPLALQAPGAPWEPRPEFGAPAQLIAMPYQRRTTVGTVSVRQDDLAHPWLGALKDVRPLSSDYPRLALCATAEAPGVIHLMRDADGSGMLDFPPPSADGADASRRLDLSEVEWSGGMATLRIELFRTPADPTATSSFRFDFPDLDATTFAEAGITVWLETISVDPLGPEGPSVQNRLRARVGTSEPLELDPIALPGQWWIRLTLTGRNGAAAGLSFADSGSRPHADRRDAAFMLLRPRAKPEDDHWIAGMPQTATATIETPRTGYFDFERWYANKDRFAATFDDAEQGRALLDLLLDAYTERHTDPAIRAVIDKLPDPAVGQILVELVRTDSLVEAATGPSSVTVALGRRLNDLAARLAANGWGRARLLKEIDALFTLPLRISTGDPLALHVDKKGVLAATIPAGVSAEIRVSPVVPAAHFQPQDDHPAIFFEGVRQLARRLTSAGALAFAPAALRIEAMHDALPDFDRALALTNAMISCRAAESVREYALVSAGAAAPGDRDLWRAIGKVDVVTQRWRPTGRPIYSYLKPAEHRADGARPGRSVVPFKLGSGSDPQVVAFEHEAFFARKDSDAETIPKALEPLRPALAPLGAERPVGTELQKFPWNAASATYFRHRFRLHSRYAGALKPNRRAVDVWRGEQDSPAGWTRRVAMLADGSRVTLTRPQLRALMPLTTAPDTLADDAPAPPVVAFLQEPPFTEGGLADRIGAEIKLGFGFGFTKGHDQVGILDARKEIGPDPRLSYSAMPEGQALAMGLVAEGPIGLTFDDPAVSAPAFANAVVSLSPIRLPTGKPVAASAASLEEHFLGVALRRYLDPDWIGPVGRPRLDGSQCLWLDYDSDVLVSGTTLLRYRSGTLPAIDLISLVEQDGQITLHMATAEADAGGANAGTLSVAITALPSPLAKLSLLHHPVAPGRYSISIFCALEPTIAAGRSNQPLLLASVEWSPPGAINQAEGEAPKDQQLPAMQLLAPFASARPTVASAPTFLAWTRTSRDFDRVVVGKPRADHPGMEFLPARWQSLVARRSTSGLPQLDFLIPTDPAATAAPTDGLDPVWLRPSTWPAPYPIHVHRHLALLGTRYAAGMGRPVEVYAGAAMAGASSTHLADAGPLSAATNLRLVEFETPAAILCSSPSVPATYRSAYFDLLSTGGSWADTVRLYLRFVGSTDYLTRFAGLGLALDYWLLDAQGVRQKAQLDLDLSPLNGAVGAEIEIHDRMASVVLLDADGTRRPIAGGALTPLDDDPGFLLRIASASGPGEFWSDVSMLHSRSGTSAAGGASAFDFDWLFSEPASDPALAVRPAALARMTEAQARIVSISPVIRIEDTA